MQSKRPLVSVVIPTLNEARNLPLVLPYLPLDWIAEIILVDGHSTDGTVEVAKRLIPEIKVVYEPRRGKGAAMRAGFASATGDILVTMDADGSNDPREIPRLVQALLEGADFVKGSRFAHGGGTTDMPRYRRWGNWALCSIANFLFNGTYTDLCYGYHAFWRHCLPTVNATIADGFEVDTAIYVRALRDRLRVTEVPSFEGYRFYGVGKLQTIPDGWRILMTILAEWADSWRTKHRPIHMGFRGYQPASMAGSIVSRAMNATPIEVIYNLSHELAVQPTLHERLVWLLQRILNLLGADSGSLMILDGTEQVVDGALIYRAQIHSLNTQQFSDVLRQGLAGWVVEHRQPALVPSTRDDPRWLQRPADDLKTSRSAICVPFALYDRVYGVLTAIHEGPHQFSQNDLALLTTIAVGVSLSGAGFLLEPKATETPKSGPALANLPQYPEGIPGDPLPNTAL